MYEGAHARPDGPSTVARVVQTARAYGFEGVVVRNHDDSSAEYDADRIEAEYGIDVVDGIEIRADSPDQASGSVGHYRSSKTILAIHGGTNEMNRFAVENEKVDVLAHPVAGSGDVNHVLVKAAVENGVRLEFNLGAVLRKSGGRRVRTIQSLRKLRELVDYYDAPYVVSADPASHLEFRAPRELRALGEQLGVSGAWIEAGLEEWRVLAERNRTIQSDSFIEPGVERGHYEEES
ncbi:ribonuclease P [Halostagnicola sp. A56]|uniref:RNase P subunit p30 family protein n=1 Tax=Halostagnicola sp. A56 TaxID=1495067 RepID=UPI00049ED24E|nr:RNase P subunit p30 family protein [Halostagnicola sp. A56]KDE59982.1 ribonuclease P [Halostagnicola sp. A56]